MVWKSSFKIASHRIILTLIEDCWQSCVIQIYRSYRNWDKIVILASNLGTSKCLVAICNQKLIGILGIQAGNGGFVNPTLRTMVKVYGILGGLIRMGGLAILHHRTTPDELYVDGVAVADDMRGNGIGSRLFELLEKKATKNNIRKISLEVIDSNPRARALYERLGFVITKKQSIWPLNLFIKFSFRSATLMVKMMGQQTN